MHPSYSLSTRSATQVQILGNPTSIFFAIPLCALVLTAVTVWRDFQKRRGARQERRSGLLEYTASSGILDEGGTRGQTRERFSAYVYIAFLALLGAMLPLFDSSVQATDGSLLGAKAELGLRAILGFLLGVPVLRFSSTACISFLEEHVSTHDQDASLKQRIHSGALAISLAAATIIAVLQAVLQPTGTTDDPTANMTAIVPPYVPSTLFLLFTLLGLPLMGSTIMCLKSSMNPSCGGTPADAPIAGHKSGSESPPSRFRVATQPQVTRTGKRASSWRASFCSRPITIHVATQRISSAEEDYMGIYPPNAIPVMLPLGGMTHCYDGHARVPSTNNKRPGFKGVTRSLRSSTSMSTIGSVAEHEWMSKRPPPGMALGDARSMLTTIASGDVPDVIRTGPAETLRTPERSLSRDVTSNMNTYRESSGDSDADYSPIHQDHENQPGVGQHDQCTQVHEFLPHHHNQLQPAQIQNLVSNAIQMHPTGEPADLSTSTDNSNSFDVCGTGRAGTRATGGRAPRGMHHRPQAHLSTLLLITAAQLSLACAYACGCALGARKTEVTPPRSASNALRIIQTASTALAAIGCVVAYFVHARSCRTSTNTADTSGLPIRQPRSWGFGFCMPSTPNFVKRRSSNTHNISTKMTSINGSLSSSLPASAPRTPCTPTYAAAYPINYGSHFHTPATQVYNQDAAQVYNSIFQHTTPPDAVYDPTAAETKPSIVQLASPRGRRARANAIHPSVIAPDVTIEVPQSCHSNKSWNSTTDTEADMSVEMSTETSALNPYMRAEGEVEPEFRAGTKRSSQLLRSVSAGRKVTTERRGSIHRSRTTVGKLWNGSKMSETTSLQSRKQDSGPTPPKRLFGWELGWEASRAKSAEVGGSKEADDNDSSFIDLRSGGFERGLGPAKLKKKTSSIAPSAFTYGVSSQVVGGSSEVVPGAPRKLKKRPKSISESTTGATNNTASHHRLSSSTFISTATAATGATRASTTLASPRSPSSASYHGSSLTRGFMGHRRIHSVSSGTGTADHRRHSALSDSSRIALKRSLTNFRRSVGRTLGPGLTLAVASGGSASNVQAQVESRAGASEGVDRDCRLHSRSTLSSPGSETPTPTRENSTTPRPARPTVITIQAPTPPASISHPFFDTTLQHKTSSSTFRSREQETVVEADDAFDMEREMEDEIQEMRSECGSSNNHRALRNFNATLNSVVPSSSETLYARYRDDEDASWGAPQTRNALSSPPVPKSDWMRGTPSTSPAISNRFPSFLSQGLSTSPLHSTPLPSASTAPDAYQDRDQSQLFPSTPRNGGSALRLSSITMGSVRSAFAGVGARMSSATSRMSVTSAAGSSTRHGQRTGANETDDDGDFMDLRDPFASPPPTSGKVKSQVVSKKSSGAFSGAGSRLGETFLTMSEGDAEDEEQTASAKGTRESSSDKRKMTAWGRLPMPARQSSAATSKRSSYTSTGKSSRATGKSSTGNRKQKKEPKERRTRKTSALGASLKMGGGVGGRGDEDVDFGLEEALLSQRLLSRLDAIAWES